MIRDKEEVRGFVLDSQFWDDYEVRRSRKLASTPVGGYATVTEAVRVCLGHHWSLWLTQSCRRYTPVEWSPKKSSSRSHK